jgi:hypothetical protein
VDSKVFSKAFHSRAACETSVHDVLAPQQLQDAITAAPSTTQTVSAHKSHKERQVQGKGAMVKTPAFKSTWKTVDNFIT